MRPNADRSLIGLCGPDFAVPVEPGKVVEFARATYSRHPDYITGKQPLMPATFLGAAGWAWGYTLERPGDTPLRQAGLEAANTLDAELGFSFAGQPPRARTTLSATTRIADVFEKRGARAGRMLFWKAVTDFRDEHGVVVADFETTSVLPEHPPAMQVAELMPAAERPSFDRDWGAELMAAIQPAPDGRLAVGSGPGEIAFPPLTLTEILRYQGATNDYNLIHHDENHARSHGYPSVISVGLLHLGALMTYATNWLGPRNVRRIRARVLGIHWPGDRLRYSGTISRTYRDGDEDRVDLALGCWRHTGERTLEVSATFVAPAAARGQGHT
jgi:acyl dehydratase